MIIQYTSSGHQSNLRYIQRKNGNPSTKLRNLNYLDNFNTLESNISHDSKAVSTKFYEKFKSYNETTAKYNNFKNQTPDQTLMPFRRNGKPPVKFKHGSSGKTGRSLP